MPALILIPSIVLLTFVISRALNALGFPKVVGLIAVGLIFGTPLLKEQMNAENVTLLRHLGDMALIALMFMAGSGTSLKKLNSEKKNALIISFLAALIPFAMGFNFFRWAGFDLGTSLIVGIAMSITAEATTAALLVDLKKINTKLGAVMIEAGLVDDIMGLTAFIITTLVLNEVNVQANALLSLSIMAFFLGVIFQGYFGKRPLFMKGKNLLYALIIPFFFVSLGMSFNFADLTINPLILATILIIAITGKIIGTLMAKPFVELSLRQLHLVGWAMNSRGAIELALALIAYRSGLISSEIYSSLIIMALVTTLIFPFIISAMLLRHPKIMD